MKPNEPSEADQRAGQADLAQLLKKAEAGDRSVLPQLRRVLDGDPDLWRGFGNLAAHAEASLAMLAAGPNLLLAECLKRKLAELKAELSGESPPPLEKLLAERISMSWLQTAYFDGLVAQAPSPLELLRAPVGETSPATTRRAGGLPRCGAGAAN